MPLSLEETLAHAYMRTQDAIEDILSVKAPITNTDEERTQVARALSELKQAEHFCEQFLARL